jgi:hypothetical protein
LVLDTADELGGSGDVSAVDPDLDRKRKKLMEDSEREEINEELQRIREWLQEKFPEEKMRTRIVLSLVA